MGSFLELAGALRETHTIGLQTLARMAGIEGVDPDDIDAFRRRKAMVLQAADVLTEQSPHEVLIRSITAAGGLFGLPEYSRDLSKMRVGMTGLWRGEILDIMPADCEARFATHKGSSRIWPSRAALIGLELRMPTMWEPPTRR